jgi:serine/threonine protein kinase
MDFVKIGDVVGGRFRIEQVVGAGSFAWVFVAHDLHSGQTVAIKLLRPERFADDDALRRFESRELRILERIEGGGHSSHVVRLLEKRLLRHEGLPFLVLEYIDGPALKEWLENKGRLDIKEAARIGAGLARGLAVIHAAGGVHRDLKPSNVRMRYGKTPVLVDLGIARALWETQKLTQGIAPLTPRYAAPEQREGLPATSAADIYALGVCLCEMLTGQTTVSFDLGLVRKAVPWRLAKLVADCVARDPRARPSAQQVVNILDDLGRGPALLRASWPMVLFSSGLVFWGQPLPKPTFDETRECLPVAGLHRQKIIRDAASTGTTLEWSFLDSLGQSRRAIRADLSDVDSSPLAVVADGALGRYEILGWSGEECRHFSIDTRVPDLTIREFGACAWPRPIAFVLGDVNGDDVDDIVAYLRTPATPDKPVSLRGTTYQRNADGSGRRIGDAFDLTPVNDYHLDLARRTGDVDGDACPDLVVATYPTGGACSSSIHVLHGDCQGKFDLWKNMAHVPLPVNRSDLGDVDEDGFLDLVTGPDDDGDPGQSFLLRGNGYGFGEAEEVLDAFSDIESGRDQPGTGTVSLEDINGDGHLDVLLGLSPQSGTSFKGGQVIYLGHGDGTFDKHLTVDHDDLKLHGAFTYLPLRGR